MNEIKLTCACNEVQGLAYVASPSSGNRVVCCCQDCQAFANFLAEPNLILDAYGGTDIYQMPVSKLAINLGRNNIACVRLTEKGLYRWYAACCHTPIGNTLGAGAPFIGLIHSFVAGGQELDRELGESRGHIYADQALTPVPDNLTGALLPITLRALRKLLMWKLLGYNKPSPFFSVSGKPLIEPKILK